jgi:FtsH-binding integral membrane protein
MYMEFNKQNATTRSSASEAIIDQGLRAYMLKVYNYMASGVLLTGIISLLVFKFSGGMNITLGPTGFSGLTNPFGELLFNSGFKWLVMLAPLGIVMYLSFGISKMSASKAQSTFWVFAALMGASLASIFIVYTQMSIARVFFITSGTFGAMSIYGYTTKRDLTKLGSFLMMGLFGIIIASVVNIFMKSTMMYFVISILGVLIFVGLTAYDTQKIKNRYLASDSGELMGKKAVMGALTLYLDFINLFIMLLRLFGQRR